MAMNMDQMQNMLAQMHLQNHANNMKLAKHFQEVSNVFSTMAQGEYQMYQHHQGMGQMTPPMQQGRY